MCRPTRRLGLEDDTLFPNHQWRGVFHPYEMGRRRVSALIAMGPTYSVHLRAFLTGEVISIPTGLERGMTVASGEPWQLPFRDAERLVEVHRTLDRIVQGEPFSYAPDGTIFRNRQGRLPNKPAGYYREYTVDTPGAPYRGTRRIVQGRGTETYYTDDHYRSFVQIDSRRH